MYAQAEKRKGSFARVGAVVIAVLLAASLAAGRVSVAEAAAPVTFDCGADAADDGPGLTAAIHGGGTGDADRRVVNVVNGPCVLRTDVELADNLTLDGGGNTFQRRGEQAAHRAYFDGLSNGPSGERGLQNVTIQNMVIDGNSDLATVPEDNRADTAIIFSSKSIDHKDQTGLYGANVRVQSVDIRRQPGVCFRAQDVDVVKLDDVRCLGPAKGGLIFAFGTSNVKVSDSQATGANDDAIAFNSGPDGAGEPASEAAQVRHAEVWNSVFSMADTEKGAALHVRGGYAISIHDNRTNPHTGAPAVGPGSRDFAALRIIGSDDPTIGDGQGGDQNSTFQSEIVHVRRNIIAGTGRPSEAIEVASSAGGIRLEDNTIKENNGCAIQELKPTSLYTAGNTYPAGGRCGYN